MEFVSVKYLGWMCLFLSAACLSPSRIHAYAVTAVGAAFVFTSAPLAGGILSAETLLCYFGLRRARDRSWVPVVLLIAVLCAAFLSCKFYAARGAWALPLGISYFTFRLIHYVQAGALGKIRPHSLVEFLSYMTFFPTYLVGPINLFPDFLRDLRRRHWDGDRFSWGLERMFYGFALLIIGGNFLINTVWKPWMTAALPRMGGARALFLQSIHLWLDLYVRFSAASSIAIGLSAMAGYRVPENFHYPFFAPNIREFWRRWHMSLTGWCREYIFTPVAAVTRRPALAVAATMAAIGIWHELSLRYVLWGLYHSLGIIVHQKWSAVADRVLPTAPVFRKAYSLAGTLLTVLFVISSFPVTHWIARWISARWP
jgi:D-alanyl-lipoteichoic acid acyltransferase DltB (MBOAT superfamily)